MSAPNGSKSRRQILEQVARGELSPEQADELLRESDRPAPAEDAPPAQPGIRKVVVGLGVGAIDVVGDRRVLEAEIEGPHQATIEGDTLIVRAELDTVAPGAFAIAVGRRGRRQRFGSEPRVFGKRINATGLRIRMNPNLELDVELDAGPLSISGMKGPIRARLAAGPMTIDGFESPLDLSVNAGAIRAQGKLTSGDSRIRSDAGAVRVELDPSSNVEIFANAALGKVVVPGADEGRGRRRQATVGTGEATLRVDTAMGSVHVLLR